MDKDTELLRMLQKLNETLSKSSATVPGGRLAGGRRERDDIGPHNSDPKRIRAIARSLDTLTDAATGAERQLNRMNRALAVSTGRLRNFNSGLKASRPQRPEVETVDASPFIDLLHPLEALRQLLGKAVAGFIRLNAQLKKGLGCCNCAGKPGGNQPPRPQPQLPRPQPRPPGGGKPVTPQQASVLGTAVIATLKGVASAGSNLIGSLTDDYYYLLERGINPRKLTALYGQAIKAGMSLQEYTRLLEDNINIASRFGSFAEFDGSLHRTAVSLGQFGQFGKEANELAASMMGSASALGVSAGGMDDAVSRQVKLFGRLHKSTLMTADRFSQLVNELRDNQNVQEELLGLDTASRAARLEQIADYSTLGQQLGLTASSANRLNQALLDQRRATAKERFQAAGTMRMAGAITGMNANDTETLARLSQKKNLSPEEKKMIVALAGTMQERIQQLQNSGVAGFENIADNLQDMIRNSSGAQIQEAAIAAELQKQSGPIKNKDMATEASKTEQQLGQVLTLMNGLVKNPFYDFARSSMKVMIAELGAIVLNTSRKNVFDIFSKLPKAGGRSPSPARAPVRGGPGPWERVKALPSRALEAAKAVPGKILGAAGRAWDTIKAAPAALKGMATGFLDSVGAVAKMLGGGLKTAGTAISGVARSGLAVLGGPVGIIISGVFSAVEEALTGDMTRFLGMDENGLFGKILGVLVASVNGIFTSFTRIADGIINWVSEGLGFSFRSNITKAFDLATSWIVLGAQSIFKKVIDVVADAISFFRGDNVPWVKGLRERSKAIDETMEAHVKNINALYDTSGVTIRTLGDKNAAAEKKLANDTHVQASRFVDASSKVTTGIEGLVDSVVRTASQPQVAVPNPPPRAEVTQPDVNTTKAAVKSDQQAAAPVQPVTLDGLVQLVELMRRQVSIAEQQLSALRERQGETRPVTFGSNNDASFFALTGRSPAAS